MSTAKSRTTSAEPSSSASAAYESWRGFLEKFTCARPDTRGLLFTTEDVDEVITGFRTITFRNKAHTFNHAEPFDFDWSGLESPLAGRCESASLVLSSSCCSLSARASNSSILVSIVLS